MKSTSLKLSLRLGAILAVACFVGACGEKVQTAGDYRGKTDSKPYDANFGGDKAKWEAEIRARAQNQNDHKRIP